MPRLLLTSWQVRSLMHYGGLPEPGAGSPLRVLAPRARPLAPGDPDFGLLIDQGLLADDGRGGWRTNFALLPFLGAALRPDEVISFGVGDPRQPGFTVARRDDVLVEATVGERGLTKLEFPLTRTAVMLTIIGALSGDRPEPEPSGFRFVGTADAAFVLATALRAHRLDGVPLTVDRLRAAVRRDLSVPARAASFAIAGAPQAIERLAIDAAAVDIAIETLVDADHLRVHLDRLEPAPQVLTALSGTATAVMGVGRAEIIDGVARSASITATRVGDRILAFRVCQRAHAEPRFEWSEVDRLQLRWLVFAILLPAADLERLRAGASIQEVTEAAPPMTTVPADQPTSDDAGAAWTATHTVPDDGLWAYAGPDPHAEPVAALDPWLPVEVDREYGDWGHVVCSNGWTCWVDRRRLVPVH